MNITGLKPFRDYDEHEVINMFTPTGVMGKGSLVAIDFATGNTNVGGTGVPAPTPYQTVNTAFGLAPAYAYGVRGVVDWRLKLAHSGNTCVGMLLYDVGSTNKFGEDFRYRPVHERHEQQVTLLGESAPFVRRGLFLVGSGRIEGTVAIGSGFHAKNGNLNVEGYNKATSLGSFLTTRDAEGYALVALNCI